MFDVPLDESTIGKIGEVLSIPHISYLFWPIIFEVSIPSSDFVIGKV